MNGCQGGDRDVILGASIGDALAPRATDVDHSSCNVTIVLSVWPFLKSQYINIVQVQCHETMIKSIISIILLNNVQLHYCSSKWRMRDRV